MKDFDYSSNMILVGRIINVSTVGKTKLYLTIKVKYGSSTIFYYALMKKHDFETQLDSDYKNHNIKFQGILLFNQCYDYFKTIAKSRLELIITHCDYINSSTNN